MIIAEHFDLVTSTNDEARRKIQSCSLDDTSVFVITADGQLKGRGQKGRVWESSKGGLYYSCACRPKKLTLQTIDSFPFRLGQQIMRRINKAFDFGLSVEWPNDFILDNKKCGGILIETHSRSSSHQPDFLIVGIGFNLNQEVFSEKLQPCVISLKQKMQKDYNKKPFIDIFTEEILECR